MPTRVARATAVVLLAVALAGCGSMSRRESPPPVSTAPRSGGYYLDDGPGDKPPPNLDRIPDAVPRVEPLHRGALRPYTVMGRSYMPMTAVVPYKARGIASWYGRRYHGKPTSSGEPYDMYAMTAAHTTLPIPSYARVTNVANGRSVIVRINDRGPFVDNRLIDLSYTAAHRLGTLAGGSAMVEVETIVPGAGAPAVTESPAPTTPAAAEPTPKPIRAAEPVVVKPLPDAAPAASPVVVPPAPVNPVPVVNDAGGSFVQLGAFASRDNAEGFVARVRAHVDGGDRIAILVRDNLFRVHAGPYANDGDARAAAQRIGQALGIKALVVNR